MNATWHPDVIGLPFLFEPYTPSPADTAWYPKELLDEARCARLGIRTISINFPFPKADGQVVLKPLQRDERHVEPWTGCGMWSEWRIPPHIPNHSGFIHPAIHQDPTSWDQVMGETNQMNAGVVAAIYMHRWPMAGVEAICANLLMAMVIARTYTGLVLPQWWIAASVVY